jgi:hypothetical protein
MSKKITGLMLTVVFRVNMEAIRPSETLVTTYKTTQHHNPEDHNSHFHCHDSKVLFLLLTLGILIVILVVHSVTCKREDVGVKFTSCCACVCVDACAPLGFEPEGSCSTAFMEAGGGSHSPPPYLRWACNLHSLLEDSDGVVLFRRYLEQEGRPHADTLDFWFACEGLKKQQNPDKINQLVKVIYR